MVAARMPAMTRPASTGGSRLVESRINTFSASDAVVSDVGKRARPIRPMNTATDREITTHTVAMRRDCFSSFSLRIAMNRRSTWGIPKYPSPHASVETMLRGPYVPAAPNCGTPSTAC